MQKCYNNPSCGRSAAFFPFLRIVVTAEVLHSKNSENIDKSGDINCSLSTMAGVGVHFYSDFRVPGFALVLGSILSVDGHPVKGLSYKEIRQLLRGPLGSDARLAMIADDDVILDVLVERRLPAPLQAPRRLATAFGEAAEALAQSNSDTRPAKLLKFVDSCLDAGLEPLVLALLERAKALSGETSIYCLLRVFHSYISLGRLAQAEEVGKKAIELLTKKEAKAYISKDPDDVIYFATILARSGLFDLAQSVYKNVLGVVDKRFSDVATVSVMEPYSQALMDKDQSEEALEYLNRIDEEYKYRSDSPTLLWLAECFDKFNQPERAVAVMCRYLKYFGGSVDTILSRFANHSHALSRLAHYQEKSGDLESAEKTLRELLDLCRQVLGPRYLIAEQFEFFSPSPAEIEMQLGKLLLRLNKNIEGQELIAGAKERIIPFKEKEDNLRSNENPLAICKRLLGRDPDNALTAYNRAWCRLVASLRQDLASKNYKMAKVLLLDLLAISERQIEAAPALCSLLSNSLLPVIFEMLMHAAELGLDITDAQQKLDVCLSPLGEQERLILLKNWATVYHYQNLPQYTEMIWQQISASSGEAMPDIKALSNEEESMANLKTLEEVEAALALYVVRKDEERPDAPFILWQLAGRLYGEAGRDLEAARAYRQAAFNCHHQCAARMDEELVRVQLLDDAYAHYKRLREPPAQEFSQIAYMLSYAICTWAHERAVALLHEAKAVLPEGDINIVGIEHRIKQIDVDLYELNKTALKPGEGTKYLARKNEADNCWQAVTYWARAAREAVDKGDLDEGLGHFKKSLECWIKIEGTGTDSPFAEEQDYLILLCRQGSGLVREQVEQMLKEVSLVLEKKLGAESYYVLSAQIQIADFLCSLGQFDDCHLMLQSILEKLEALAQKETYAPERVYFAPMKYIRKIAERCVQSGLAERGISYYQRLSQCIKDSKWMMDASYPISVFELGRLHLLNDDIAQAESTVRRSISLMRALPSLRFTGIMRALALHAELLRALGKEEEAVQVLTGRGEVSLPREPEEYYQLLD